MNTEIAVALITLIGVLASAFATYKVAAAQHDKTMALLEQRLEQLESKVDKHNNLVERMYHVEAELDAMIK